MRKEVAKSQEGPDMVMLLRAAAIANEDLATACRKMGWLVTADRTEEEARLLRIKISQIFESL